MDRRRNAAPTDFDFLNQLKSLSFLSPVARHDLASQLDFADFRRGAPIFHESYLWGGVQ